MEDNYKYLARKQFDLVQRYNALDNKLSKKAIEIVQNIKVVKDKIRVIEQSISWKTSPFGNYIR